MVYLAGDNNLSEHMAYSLESLRRFAFSMTDYQRSKINLLAYFDGASITAPTMYVDLSDPATDRLGFCQPLTQELCVHQDGEQNGAYNHHDNSASPDALLNFVRWCTGSTSEGLRGRPAENYALIVSGHSLGFHGTTFLHDEGTGRHFTLPQFRETLERANELYLSGIGNPISILGFDSCLMSMAEVGYELQNVASTMVASQGSLPNTGWGYCEMLGSFAKTLEAGGGEESLAASLVESFTDLHHSLAVGGRSIDISAWRLGKTGDIAAAVDRLARELRGLLCDQIQGDRAETARILKRIILQSHYDSQTYMAEQSVDLKDLCQRLIEECSYGEQGDLFMSVVEAAEEVIDSVDESVIRCGFSGENYQFSNGISIFFPWSSLSFAVTDSQYRALRFVNDRESTQISEWYSFLLEYVGNVSLRRSRKASGTASGNLVSGGVPLRTTERAIAVGSRDFLPLTKDGLPFTKDGLPFTKDFLPLTKDGLPFTKGGLSPADVGTSNYLSRFATFKNYEIGWNISGFAEK